MGQRGSVIDDLETAECKYRCNQSSNNWFRQRPFPRAFSTRFFDRCEPQNRPACYFYEKQITLNICDPETRIFSTRFSGERSCRMFFEPRVYNCVWKIEILRAFVVENKRRKIDRGRDRSGDVVCRDGRWNRGLNSLLGSRCCLAAKNNKLLNV